MADNRPWAKIDVGYHWNRKWFEIERAMRDAMPDALPIAVRHAVRAARDAHAASILYCRQGATDGLFPVQAIKAMAGIYEAEEDAALTYLFDSGMWVNHPGGMAEVRDFLEHQTDSDTTKQRSERARKAAEARWAKHAERNASSSAGRNAERNAEKRREEKRREEVNVAETRDDVEALLDHLDQAIEANGAKKPGRTKTNRDAMRLLLDRDGRTPDQVRAAIDWAHSDDFWRANILSAKKLREKYDTLQLQAQRGRNPTNRPDRATQIYLADAARYHQQETEGETRAIGQ